jgi:uncharacterized protein YaaN involved in tellurite resistance
MQPVEQHSSGNAVSARVGQWLSLMETVTGDDQHTIGQLVSAIPELGRAEQQAFWQLNNRLVHPLQQLMADTRAGGQVSTLLQSLQRKVKAIHPPEKRRPGLWQRLMLLFSEHNSPWEMWLAAYPDEKKQLMALVERLDDEKQQLIRDNHILNADHEQVSAAVKDLERACDQVNAFTQQLSAADQLDAGFRAELLPEVQRRLIELQQQLLIGRQAVLTIDLLIKQNKSLINGIEQAVYSTTSAVNVAAGVALASRQQQTMAGQEQAGEQSIDVARLEQAQQLIEQTIQQMQQVRKDTESLTGEIQNKKAEHPVND